MNKNSKIEVFINPLQLLEIDDPWASAIKKSLTPDAIFKFMCTPGVPSDIESLSNRYKEISQEKPRLFIAPHDQRILEKLIWPLRHAKASYIVGNFLSTISLCGMVAEMIAIFIFEISLLDDLVIKSKKGDVVSSEYFEKLTQDQRVKILFKNKVIDNILKTEFDFIRQTRRKYLHLWSHDHDLLPHDALTIFHTMVSIVVKAFGLDISHGELVLKPNVLKYLNKSGTYKTKE